MSLRYRLIDWVDARGRLWGIARRRLDLKLEDWPESVWSRIRDGVPPENYREQHFLEVFEGDALLFRRALTVLTAKQYCHTYTHYVIPVSIKQKIQKLGHSRENYYNTLCDAHRKLASAMQSLTRSSYEQSSFGDSVSR